MDIIIHIKPDAVEHASLDGISYKCLYDIAYKDAIELISQMNNSNPKIQNKKISGFSNEYKYSYIWELNRYEKDVYVYTIIGNAFKDKQIDDIEEKEYKTYLIALTDFIKIETD